jgi:hypothetical protein
LNQCCWSFGASLPTLADRWFIWETIQLLMGLTIGVSSICFVSGQSSNFLNEDYDLFSIMIT